MGGEVFRTRSSDVFQRDSGKGPKYPGEGGCCGGECGGSLTAEGSEIGYNRGRDAEE